jgi:hypothetical protein
VNEVFAGDRLCARGLVLRHAEEPDLIRHQPPMPEDGRAVASFVQESLIRDAHPERSTSTTGRRN